MIFESENLLILGFVIISLFFIKGPNLSYYWFIINGIWIHIYLDGLIGVFQQNKWLFQKYSELDARYPLKESTVMGVSGIEIFFMGPMCIWIALRIKNQNKNQLLTIILITFVSACQIMGTFLFFIGAWIRDFKDVCENSCFSLTPSNIFYFWIIFLLVNPIWIIVPFQQIIVSYKALNLTINSNKIKSQ